MSSWCPVCCAGISARPRAFASAGRRDGPFACGEQYRPPRRAAHRRGRNSSECSRLRPVCVGNALSSASSLRRQRVFVCVLSALVAPWSASCLRRKAMFINGLSMSAGAAPEPPATQTSVGLVNVPSTLARALVCVLSALKAISSTPGQRRGATGSTQAPPGPGRGYGMRSCTIFVPENQSPRHFNLSDGRRSPPTRLAAAAGTMRTKGVSHQPARPLPQAHPCPMSASPR
jgi:hypothetical protein